MQTYQDFLQAQTAGQLTELVRRAVCEHKASAAYRDALAADEYDAGRNPTIRDFARTLFTAQGGRIPNDTVSNNRLASNFFARLNVQRCTYSLGNGLTFQRSGVGGRLGPCAGKTIQDAGYHALIHGVAFLYWAYDHIHLFRLTEFAPLWDETSGNLGAGVRFWQLAPEKPLYATLYTPDGYREYRCPWGSTAALEPVDGVLHPYRMTVQTTPATGGEVRTAHNYSALPIVPLWGSRLHQSTLVGMRAKIDAFDIVQSGFANDMQDCAQIYWLIQNAGGMTERDLSAFRERLLYRHVATVNTSDGASVTPYTQEIPYEARSALLDRLRRQIYEDFGALDVANISAAARTATEINAAYQPMDEAADDFEAQVVEAVQKLLALQGVSPEDATPQFKRNRVCNQLEQVQMVMLEASYLDDETLLNKLPNLSPEEVAGVLRKRAAEALSRVDLSPEADNDA